MRSRVTVLCSMTTVNLESSLVCKLFTDYGLSLEILGIDLLNIFKSHMTSDLFLESLIVDMQEMIQVGNYAFKIDEAFQDLKVLLNEISKHLSYIHINESRLINVQFQGIDTLILEFYKL